MANEIQLTSKLSVSKGGASVTNLTSTDTIDMSGANMNGIVQDVGTSFEAADVGDVATASAYFLHIYNMDTTNYMEVSFDAGSSTHCLIPPESFFGPVKMNASKTIQVKFNTAAGNAFITACES